MGLKVAERAQILEQMTAGKISQTEAARRIGVTVRQVNHLDKHYRAFGLGVDQQKARAHPQQQHLACRTGARYADFCPTLATEKLCEQHALTLSVETVRQQMIAEGLWQPKRGGKVSVHPMRCHCACLVGFLNKSYLLDSVVCQICGVPFTPNLDMLALSSSEAAKALASLMLLKS